MPRPRKPETEKTYTISIRVPYRLKKKWHEEIVPLIKQKGLKQWEVFEKCLEVIERWLKHGIPP